MAQQRRTHRLFLALWPDDKVRTRVSNHCAAWSLPPGSLCYEPQDWHVTLHFLGSVAEEQIPGIADGLHVALEPTELVLDQPQRWRGGLAVLSATSIPPTLTSLHKRLATALRGLDQAVEARPWRPHLTLARRAGTAMPPAAFKPITWPVHNYALVVSTGRPEQRYLTLRDYG